MSNPNDLPQHAAVDLGIIRVLQALTAVVYRDAPERDKLEAQLKTYLNSPSTGFEGTLLATYKAPIEGALQVIEQIKAAQAKG